MMQNQYEIIEYALLFKSFYIGLKFDMVILGYLTLIPCLILFLFSENKFIKLHKINFLLYSILCAFSFIISTVDIIYFASYKSHLNSAAFHWIDNPKFVFDLLIQDKLFLIPLLLSLFLLFTYFYYVTKLNRLKNSNQTVNPLIKVFIIICLIITIRGRLDFKSPIRVGTAYFSNDALLNELGLNANFVLIRSFLDKKQLERSNINLVDEQTMNTIIRNEKNNAAFNTCTYPKGYQDNLKKLKKNIVLILMESMGKSCFSSNTKLKTTPFLDSIKMRSTSFENFYSSGIHTFNGIFSTLYSIPSYSVFHPLKLINVNLKAIPINLQNQGYYNIYFTTHDGQFDNVEGFLYKNGFNEVISDDHYPISERKTNLGVTDEYMLNYSLDKLTKINPPFFCTILTSSNHTPFYLPPHFKKIFDDDRLNSIAYSDFALQAFFNKAKKQKWFKNTIFVLVADHGIKDQENFPISLNYNEIPFIIYDPNSIEYKTKNNLGSQIDVLPTVLDYLELECSNNNFGINLNCNERQLVVYNYDDKYVVMSKNFIFIESFDRSFSKLYEKHSKKFVKI
ncbi:MAG: LTA synthase family protein [Saprospiraceae bacterium]|nr:LTA synthase family protein [Saprospiraceae bacterium]